MRFLIALVIAFQVIAMAQSKTGSSKTTGPCSTAISGSNNTVNLDCKGAEKPTVEIAYSPGLLPILIKPNSCVTILGLNRKVKDFPNEMCNSSASIQTIVYPANIAIQPQDFATVASSNGGANYITVNRNETGALPKDKHWRAQHIATSTRKGGSQVFNDSWFDVVNCYITNHSDEDLVNVKMDFVVSFRGVKSVDASYRHDGTIESLTVEIRALKDGGTIWTDHDYVANVTQGWTEGADISTEKKRVVLRSIPRHQMANISVITQSHYPVRFDLPTRIVALVSGSDKEQSLKLIRPRSGIFDVFPRWGMPPSKYPWPGIVDDSK